MGTIHPTYYMLQSISFEKLKQHSCRYPGRFPASVPWQARKASARAWPIHILCNVSTAIGLGIWVCRTRSKTIGVFPLRLAITSAAEPWTMHCDSERIVHRVASNSIGEWSQQSLTQNVIITPVSVTKVKSVSTYRHFSLRLEYPPMLKLNTTCFMDVVEFEFANLQICHPGFGGPLIRTVFSSRTFLLWQRFAVLISFITQLAGELNCQCLILGIGLWNLGGGFRVSS